MRFASILLLLLLATSVAKRGLAQPLPESYSEGLRMLILEKSDRSKELKRFRLMAEKNGNETFNELLALQQDYYRLFDGPGNPGDVEKSLLARLKKYRAAGWEFWETQTLIHLSQVCWNGGRHGAALEYGLQAREHYIHWSGNDFPLTYKALYELGSKFYYYQDFESAEFYLKEALATTGAAEPVGRNNVLNTLGLCYRNTGHYDSASVSFERALRLTQPTDSVWYGIIRGNLGITRFLQNRVAEAVPLLRADIQASLKNGAALDNAINSMAILGEIYLRQGRPEAGLVLDSARALAESRHLFDNDYKLLSALYPRLAALAEARGQVAQARDFWRAAAIARDSFTRKTNSLVLAGARLNVEAGRHAAEREALEQHLRLQTLARNSLIAGIVLLATIVILLIKRMQARHQLRTQQAAAELAAAAAQLEAFTEALHEKNALIERFRQQVEDEDGTKEVAARADTLARLRTLTILTEDEWLHFQSLYEKVHVGFFNRLAGSWPGLTPADVRYIALRKLGFSNKEIAAVLGIGSGSVRSILSRLRKRLGLSDEEDLDILIGAI